MCIFWGCFRLFSGSDGGPWGLGCLMRPPWIGMRADGDEDWIGEQILARHDMILTTSKGARENVHILGLF